MLERFGQHFVPVRVLRLCAGLHLIAAGTRPGITLTTATKLAHVLGLRLALRPVRKGKRSARA